MSSSTLKTRSRMAGAALLVLALAATAVVWWQSQDRAGDEGVPPTGATFSESTAAVRESASIAVLPLESLTPGQEKYFADGMTDALITHLSKIEALKVISRISAMRYKGTKKSLAEIAGELGVETVLNGTVLLEGGRVRISCQLVEAGTDRNIWAESYEKDMSSILALQGEVARAIAGAVEVEVGPGVEMRMTTSRAIDPGAYGAYLRGLADLEGAYQGGGNQRELLMTSFRHLQTALEIEPDWADPQACLACGYRLFASLGGPAVQAEFYPKARDAAVKAMAQIEAAFAARSDFLMTLRCSTEYESFMKIPRFREIIAAIGSPY